MVAFCQATARDLHQKMRKSCEARLPTISPRENDRRLSGTLDNSLLAIIVTRFARRLQRHGRLVNKMILVSNAPHAVIRMPFAGAILRLLARGSIRMARMFLHVLHRARPLAACLDQRARVSATKKGFIRCSPLNSGSSRRWSALRALLLDPRRRWPWAFILAAGTGAASLPTARPRSARRLPPSIADGVQRATGRFRMAPCRCCTRTMPTGAAVITTFSNRSAERFELHFKGEPTRHRDRRPDPGQGQAGRPAIAVESGRQRDSREPFVRHGHGPGCSALAASGTFGAQRTAVMLVNFSNNPVQPYTAATAQERRLHHHQQLRSGEFLRPDLADRRRLRLVHDRALLDRLRLLDARQPGAGGSHGGRREPGQLQSLCLRVSRRTPAAGGDLGTVGGNPSSAWINGSLQLAVVGHEMGHNFGLYHSHALECGSVPIGTGCTSVEYGDQLDIMGNSHPTTSTPSRRNGWGG